MKKLIILIASLVFAFEVEFTKIHKEYVVPNENAILIKTQKTLTFPFKFVKTPNGYILFGDINQINYWLENNFYLPEDAKIENIKIAVIDMDKIQYKILKELKNKYKDCEIKKVIFLTPDEEKVILKPQTITTKYKIILDCK
jgi:hypothetical protein